MNPTTTTSFCMLISSDPQYPWYDGVLPDGLTTEEEIKENSNRQILQKYASMNQLAQQRREDGSPFPVEGVQINGDLTAFGHDWQFDECTKQLATLQVKYFPGLGNHDYQNNVDDTYNNNAASRMVDFMYYWLKNNAGILSYDFSEKSYYKFPELRTDYTGSLAYSYNIGKVHFVQLQNFPSYMDDWNTWNLGAARRDFYYIRKSFYWLKNDLAIARNRGDIIIVSLHDYHDNFVEDLGEFNKLLKHYGVSAVFAGHIHPDCGYISNIPDSTIPYFRSGSASYQDYLGADIDVASKTMRVFKLACPYDGDYGPTGDQWSVVLDDTIPNPPLPVPPLQGFVTFFNEGGFEAKFELQYTAVSGDRIIEQTGTMLLGNKKTYQIPPDATDVWLIAKENTGLVWEGWRTVFDLRYPSPPNLCYKLYGTTLNPKWNNSCS